MEFIDYRYYIIQDTPSSPELIKACSEIKQFCIDNDGSLVYTCFTGETQ